MRHRVTIPIIAVIGAFLALSWAWGAEGCGLTMEDSGKKIQVSAETVITIALEEKGATGYQWHFDESDIRQFAVIDSKASLPKKILVGAPVLRTWKLKAKRPGTFPLRMYCYRSWEGRESAVDRFAVAVEVR